MRLLAMRLQLCVLPPAVSILAGNIRHVLQDTNNWIRSLGASASRFDLQHSSFVALASTDVSQAKIQLVSERVTRVTCFDLESFTAPGNRSWEDY